MRVGLRSSLSLLVPSVNVPNITGDAKVSEMNELTCNTRPLNNHALSICLLARLSNTNHILLKFKLAFFILLFHASTRTEWSFRIPLALLSSSDSSNRLLIEDSN